MDTVSRLIPIAKSSIWTKVNAYDAMLATKRMQKENVEYKNPLLQSMIRILFAQNGKMELVWLAAKVPTFQKLEFAK